MPSSPAASGRATLPQTLGISSPAEQGAPAAPSQATPPGDGTRGTKDPRAD